jgi:hypothetical protein
MYFYWNNCGAGNASDVNGKTQGTHGWLYTPGQPGMRPHMRGALRGREVRPVTSLIRGFLPGAAQ